MAQSEGIIDRWISETITTWQQIPVFKAPEQIKHLAVICDGDRRAAQDRGLKPQIGHHIGMEVVKGITQCCLKWDINALTFWLWSTENWGRKRNQIDFIFELARHYLYDPGLKDQLYRHKVRFTQLGRKDRLPPEIEQGLRELELSTSTFNKRWLNLAIDYGGEDEIERAVLKALNDQKTDGFLRNHLDTYGQPEVDLVIRTGINGNELPHTSGFMPLQTKDAAWIFLEELFPNLTPADLLSSIERAGRYQKRAGL